MRFEGSVDPIHTMGMMQPKRMTILANEKSFRSIIDGMYSRKIEAPQREWLANATDSHQLAGQTRPMTVKLPTDLDPTFRVRDYGVGMDEEFMDTRFNTLYDSTKDGLVAEDAEKHDPNLTTGTLGIGRMSFFTITDGAIFTCYDGENKRVYSVHIADGKIPQSVMVSKTPCSEPRGVSCEFSVKRENFSQFLGDFRKVLLGLDQTPEILPLHRREEVLQDHYKTVSRRKYGELEIRSVETNCLMQGLYAQQGTVIYPLSLAELFTREEIKSLGLEYLNSHEVTIVRFPIGTLKFTPSRETLEYDEKTIKRAKAILETYAEEAKKEVEGLLSEKRTDYETALLLDQVLPLSPMGKYIFHRLATEKRTRLGARLASTRRESAASERYSYYRVGEEYALPEAYRTASVVKLDGSVSKVRPVGSERSFYVACTILVEDDERDDLKTRIKRRYVERITNYMEGLNQKNREEKKIGGLDEFGRYSRIVSQAVFYDRVSNHLHQLLGFMPIVKLSSLPYPPVAKNEKKKKEEFRKYSLIEPRIGRDPSKAYMRRKSLLSKLPVSPRTFYFLSRAGEKITDIRSGAEVEMDSVLMKKIIDLGYSICLITFRSNEKIEKFTHLPSYREACERIVKSFSRETVSKFMVIRNFGRIQTVLPDLDVDLLEPGNELDLRPRGMEEIKRHVLAYERLIMTGASEFACHHLRKYKMENPDWEKKLLEGHTSSFHSRVPSYYLRSRFKDLGLGSLYDLVYDEDEILFTNLLEYRAEALGIEMVEENPRRLLPKTYSLDIEKRAWVRNLWAIEGDENPHWHLEDDLESMRPKHKQEFLDYRDRVIKAINQEGI